MSALSRPSPELLDLQAAVVGVAVALEGAREFCAGIAVTSGGPTDTQPWTRTPLETTASALRVGEDATEGSPHPFTLA